MDPLSQAVVGGIAGQAGSQKKHYILATAIACLAGMAPDLDVIIRSDADPLFALQYHRHFTHALLFVPIGGLLCAITCYYLFSRWRISFKQTYLYSVAGYATHALLDACTSYGTQLFLPLSNYRVAWNNVSVIDPLFTVPLLLMLILAACYRSKGITILAIIYGLAYLMLGVVQNQRALAIGKQLAASRGHSVSDISAKPSFANLLVWKTIYQSQHRFYVDAVRVGLSSKVYQGESVARLDIETDFPWLDTDSQQAKDLQRFDWFSDGYLALSPDDNNLVVDMRYSTVPNQIEGLWGIRLKPDAQIDEHVDYISREQGKQVIAERFAQLWAMIVGK